MKKSPNLKKTTKKEDELATGDEAVSETSVETLTETSELSAESAEESVSETETTPEVETVAATEPVITPEPVHVDEPKSTPVMASSATAGSSSSSVSGGSDGIGALGKALVVGLFILLAGIGLLIWKAKGGSVSAGSGDYQGLTKLTKSDMELLLKDANPMLLKRLAEDPETKKKQIESIKQLLALAEEGRKTQVWSDDPKKNADTKKQIADDLEDIRTQIIALSYDKEKNKDKEQLPPFSTITKEDVDKYYAVPANAQKVDEVIKEKIAQAKAEGVITEDPTEEQLGQFKEQYGKTNISYKEAMDNWGKLSEDFKHATELQVKLQQAQVYARAYAEKVLPEKIKATDDDVKKYIAEHPDEDKDGEVAKYLEAHPPMSKEQKKAQAEDLLKRAKAGEDFAQLATQFSEDPGSKNDGGLYKDVPKGQMMPEFEKAALALEPGQVADSLVETKYGFHIIKLERKGPSKDKDGKDQDTYDARHILISTTPDPQSPVAAIKQKIEDERQKDFLADLVKKNPIEVAEDFEVKVPPMPEGQPNGLPPGVKLDPKQLEQLQKQMKEAQEKQKNDPKAAPKAAPSAAAPKK